VHCFSAFWLRSKCCYLVDKTKNNLSKNRQIIWLMTSVTKISSINDVVLKSLQSVRATMQCSRSFSRNNDISAYQLNPFRIIKRLHTSIAAHFNRNRNVIPSLLWAKYEFTTFNTCSIASNVAIDFL
jgi:hypothetical protein